MLCALLSPSSSLFFFLLHDLHHGSSRVTRQQGHLHLVSDVAGHVPLPPQHKALACVLACLSNRQQLARMIAPALAASRGLAVDRVYMQLVQTAILFVTLATAYSLTRYVV